MVDTGARIGAVASLAHEATTNRNTQGQGFMRWNLVSGQRVTLMLPDSMMMGK